MWAIFPSVGWKRTKMPALLYWVGSDAAPTDVEPAVKAISAAVGLALAVAAAASAAQDVGVSVSISQPGVYGRIDIGNRPPPPLVYAQPVIIARPRVMPQPVYMHVPPGHAKNWGKHCHRYHACGTPVYFVREGWDRDDGRYERRDRGDDRHGSYDRRDRRGAEDDHPGHGHGRGQGHGRHGH